MVLETKRLLLREMTQADYSFLCQILQDDDVMYAYEGAFSAEEVREWLDGQMKRYKEYGFGLWAVEQKETGILIGQCGLTLQDYKDNKVMEVGYLFQKEHLHHGYASEAAIACKEYAFDKLNAEVVYSIIRDTNIPSQSVAAHNGMTCIDKFIKHYRGIPMPHFVFSVKRQR